MNKEDKLITDSLLREACIEHRERAIAHIDKEKIFDNLDAELATKSGGQRQFFKIKKRKAFLPALAMTACAAVCTLLITGGAINMFEPAVYDVDPSTQSTGNTSNSENLEAPKEEENVTTKTEETPGQYQENDTTNVTQGKIVLSGGEKGVNYTNPTTIILKKDNLDKGTCTWTITKYKKTKVLYKGTGTTVKAELAQLIDDKQDGNYIISFSYQDKDGNSFTTNDGFAISTQTEE